MGARGGLEACSDPNNGKIVEQLPEIILTPSTGASHFLLQPAAKYGSFGVGRMRRKTLTDGMFSLFNKESFHSTYRPQQETGSRID